MYVCMYACMYSCRFTSSVMSRNDMDSPDLDRPLFHQDINVFPSHNFDLPGLKMYVCDKHVCVYMYWLSFLTMYIRTYTCMYVRMYVCIV